MAFSILIALGSNRGDRLRWLRAGVDALCNTIDVVRISSVYETEPLDTPEGSPPFLNLVVAGSTSRTPAEVLDALLAIERRLGRTRGVRNAPRTIDLDLIFHSAHVARSKSLTLPHPRYRDREFVLAPLRELRLRWRDPLTNREVASMRGKGAVTRVAALW
ncbi:MAG: 2-amino-4-hydroxy-6-hydroxymethyldihydropteridine diphosphokinase [Thermoanaerobaculia bacterium]